MPKIPVYTQEGASAGDVNASERVFGVKPDAALVHEVMVAQRANARRAIANVKTRGEVSGGGKKPWKQKGTGRARQGSIRSPQWKGGGVVFGPTSERNFSVKVNRKAKQKALFMALSDKLAHQQLIALESVHVTGKTKVMADMMKKLPVGKTTLLVAPQSTPMLVRMVRNLPNVKMVTAQSVNLIDVLQYRTLVFLKDAVSALEKLYHA